MSDEATRGLPDDLASMLSDPSIDVPQDVAVFNLVHSWMAAPSTTMSAEIIAPTKDPLVRFGADSLKADTGTGCPQG